MIAVPEHDPAATHDRSPHGRRVILECTLVVVLVAAAFLLRLLPLSMARFWDEAVYLQNAEVICCGKVNYSELDSRPPLLSLLFAAVFLLWHHVYAASIVTALLNTVGPVLLYVSGRLIAGRIPAAIASLLLAFSPFFVSVFPPGLVSADTGNSLLSDSPALTLLLLSFWLLLRAVRKQTDLGFVCAGFVLALAVVECRRAVPSRPRRRALAESCLDMRRRIRRGHRAVPVLVASALRRLPHNVP